ncbi:MAG TPA: molybdopterin-binding protein, partial [Dyella sp.]|nr:molybdopterin-binding protein [Dyella sp.]
VTSGAVSMGRYDFVPQTLDRLGAQTLFHKVAIRPGKPLLFARLPNDVLLFGLPGNPIAVAVGLRFFVEPALRVMLGLPQEAPHRVPLSKAYSKKPRLRFHLKSNMHIDARGQLAIEVLEGQESYRIGPLSKANAWAVVSADVEALPAGALVDVYGVGHFEFPLPHESVA